MTAEEILKMTIGDLVYQGVLMQAKIAELEAKLKAAQEKKSE